MGIQQVSDRRGRIAADDGRRGISNLVRIPFYVTPFALYSEFRHFLAKRLTMKLPGPDHPISITANPKRIRVTVGGTVIADSTHALTLKEASYPAVQYVPRSDANMALLARTDRVTHCPYKGDANYFNITVGSNTLENSIWSYEKPFPAMTEIAGYLAFYPDKVTIEQIA
jgi:uncharacterized protein (DUF427 family)